MSYSLWRKIQRPLSIVLIYSIAFIPLMVSNSRTASATPTVQEVPLIPAGTEEYPGEEVSDEEALAAYLETNQQVAFAIFGETLEVEEFVYTLEEPVLDYGDFTGTGPNGEPFTLSVRLIAEIEIDPDTLPPGSAEEFEQSQVQMFDIIAQVEGENGQAIVDGMSLTKVNSDGELTTEFVVFYDLGLDSPFAEEFATGDLELDLGEPTEPGSFVLPEFEDADLVPLPDDSALEPLTNLFYELFDEGPGETESTLSLEASVIEPGEIYSGQTEAGHEFNVDVVETVSFPLEEFELSEGQISILTELGVSYTGFAGYVNDSPVSGISVTYGTNTEITIVAGEFEIPNPCPLYIWIPIPIPHFYQDAACMAACKAAYDADMQWAHGEWIAAVTVATAIANEARALVALGLSAAKSACVAGARNAFLACMAIAVWTFWGAALCVARMAATIALCYAAAVAAAAAAYVAIALALKEAIEAANALFEARKQAAEAARAACEANCWRFDLKIFWWRLRIC